MAATADCYLAHCAREQLVDLDACRAQLGRYFSLLRDINDLDFNIEVNSMDEDVRRRNILLDDLRIETENMPSP